MTHAAGMRAYAFRIVGIGFLALLFLAIPVQSHAITKATNAPVTTGPVVSKSWPDMSSREKVQFVCFLSAAILLFVAEVWFIVAGFKTSVGWGLFMLFIGGTRSIFGAVALVAWLVHWILLDHALPSGHPFFVPTIVLTAITVFIGVGAIIFIVRHWDNARGPLKTMVFGLLLGLAGVGVGLIK